MKNRFPSYVTSFTCTCNPQEAANRILETVACKNNNLKLVEVSHSEIQKIVFRATTGSFLYYNSFLPLTTIEIKGINNGSFVSISFKLMKSVRIIMAICSIVAVLLELLEIAYVIWLTKQFTLFPQLFIPVGVILLGFSLSCIGLRSSSKGVLRKIFNVLPTECADRLPSIHIG